MAGTVAPSSIVPARLALFDSYKPLPSLNSPLDQDVCRFYWPRSIDRQAQISVSEIQDHVSVLKITFYRQ